MTKLWFHDLLSSLSLGNETRVAELNIVGELDAVFWEIFEKYLTFYSTAIEMH